MATNTNNISNYSPLGEGDFHTADLSNSSFLVTGGAGFIGGHITEYLLKNGAKKVRVLDNMVNGFNSNLEILQQYPAFEFLEGDIRNAETCAQACNGIDYISHQAALGSVPRSIKEPLYFTEVNVGGFANMLKAAVDAKVKTFVYASSSSVYGDEQTLPKKEKKLVTVYHLMLQPKKLTNCMHRFLPMYMVLS